MSASFQCRNPVSPFSRFPPCQGKALELCSYHFIRDPLAIRRGDPLTLSSLQMVSLLLSKPQASSYSLWPPHLSPLVLSSDKNDGGRGLARFCCHLGFTGIKLRPAEVKWCRAPQPIPSVTRRGSEARHTAKTLWHTRGGQRTPRVSGTSFNFSLSTANL